MNAPRWSLREIARQAGGSVVPGTSGADPATTHVGYRQISLDSRTLGPGDLFVALRGETHDGHDFLPEVEAAGASAALVAHPRPAARMAQIVAEDTLGAWQSWSAAHRDGWSGRVVGVTGSSGKTTAKDILAHLLAGEAGVWATEGSRNNHVGLPWTLLGLDPAHAYAIIEMGMNHPGEIGALSKLARPELALITGIGRAHIGYLGSRAAVLAAKLEILEGAPEDAPVVLPADPWIEQRLPETVRRRPRRSFGLDLDADWHPRGAVSYQLDGTRFETEQTGPLTLSIVGPGALLSALAALATVDALGLDPRRLASRLATVPRQRLRMEPRRDREVDWLLDCYNASPESSRLAIEFLKQVEHPGRRVLVLGELGELGAESETIHAELGELAAGIDVAIFVGSRARIAWQRFRERSGAGQAHWTESREDAAVWLDGRLRPGDLVLLKAARRLALERILERLAPELITRGKES